MMETEAITGVSDGLGIRLHWLDRTDRIGYEPALNPFARDELLCRLASSSGEGFVHLWRHPRAFIMGLRDSRLPGSSQAASWLRDLGYSVAVRNSGGAAVPLDLGVLNVSLVLPKPEGKLGFRGDFERMAELLQGSFAARTKAVKTGEVAGSYCPGEFDLAIGGRKFCGIAQRRQAGAIVVQAFIVVEGTGIERAALARAFYEKATEGAHGLEYPLVRPETMGSLSELTGLGLTAPEAASDVLAYMQAVEELVPCSPDVISEEDVLRKAGELEARYAPPASEER